MKRKSSIIVAALLVGIFYITSNSLAEDVRDEEIKWMNKSVTVNAARKLGLPEEGLTMINVFLRKA